jgi:peroxiredoxin (alkyl hydroperoxide reductase subunit C)
MVRVGSAAPHFDGAAVVDGRLVRLNWHQVHEDRTLILLFDPIGGTSGPPEYPVAVSNALARLGGRHARVAVVWRNNPDALLAWANSPRAAGGPGALAFPLVADPDSRIAALYGLSDSGREPLWGRFVIDPSGIVRQAVVSGFPAWAGVDDLLEIIRTIDSATPAGR